jgi:hypothetical protein
MAGAAPTPAAKPAAAPAADVAVRSADGTLGTVPQAQLQQMIDAGGQVVDRSELAAATRSQELEAKYGSQGAGLGGALVNQSLAHAAGFARGASLGLSDPGALAIAEAFGGQGAREGLRERLQGYKEAQGYQSTEGELAGVAASMLLGNEGASAGKVGQVLGAPARAVARAGEGAESIAAALGAGKLGGVARAGVMGAARGGVENLAYGVGSDISEAALGNHDVTAEKLLASAPGHFGIGALLGGGLGVGGALGPRAKGAIAEALGGHSGLAESLERRSEDLAWSAARPTQKMTEAMKRYGPDAGRIIRDEAPGLVGKASFGELAHEDLAKAAEAGKAKYGAKLDEAIDKIDSLASKAGEQPSVGHVLENIRTRVLEPLSREAGQGQAIAKVKSFLQDIEEITGSKGAFEAARQAALDAGQPEITAHLMAESAAANTPMTLRQMRDFRVNADKLWAGAKINPEYGPMKAVRDALEDDLVSRAEVLSHGTGASLGAEYEAAKKGYQAFKMLEKSAARGEAQAATNQFLSLTDKGFAGAGAIAGSVLGGPVGAAVGGALSGLASRAFRGRFDFWAAEGMQRAARVLRMAEESRRIDTAIVDGVRGFLESKPGRASAPYRAAAALGHGPAERQENFRAVAKELSAAKSDPEAYARRMASKLGDLPAQTPGVAQALTTALARIVGQVASRMPQDGGRSPELSSKVTESVIDDAGIAKFARYLRASAEPLSILQSLKDGTITNDEVAAVRENYPNIFRQIQETVMREIQGDGKIAGRKTTYEQRILLGEKLGIPSDPTLEPRLVGAAQAAYATPEGNQEQKTPSAMVGKPPAQAEQMKTADEE